MQAISRAMVDILAEQTGQSVGMHEANYIYISTREIVAQSDVDTATAIYKKEMAQAQAKADKKRAKLAGLKYASTGVTVPFTADDALGLLQVQAAFQLGLAKTVIKFSNGQSLPISALDFPAFATWFATERNKFFI